MSPEDLKRIWSGLERPRQHILNGQRLPMQSLEAWIALDHSGIQHILIGVPLGTEVLTSNLRGLRVITDRMQIADFPIGTFLDFSCGESHHLSTFAAFGADLIRRLIASPSRPRDVAVETLAHWRRFWSNAQDGLTREEAIGLFGELWFLLRWTNLPESIQNWAGPSGSDHDFQWEVASVEVKATQVRTDGSASHRITSLDQLDAPQSGALYLFSLQLALDPLASNTLQELIDLVSSRLEQFPGYYDVFLDKLSACGYSPSHATHYAQRWRIVAEEVYSVTDTFPRLTRASFPNGLPPGVDNVSYTLSLSACRPWRIATNPSERGGLPIP